MTRGEAFASPTREVEANWARDDDGIEATLWIE